MYKRQGYEYKDGKQPALRGKGHARFARFRSLGKGYSVEELCEVIAGNVVHKSKFAEKNRTNARSAQVHQKAELSFLIDVRAKMQAGKGAGYARWAKVFNLKQMAKAMMFMEEHGIKNYAEQMCIRDSHWRARQSGFALYVGAFRYTRGI